ncbi:hypothetical protein MRB53_037025 [Persea americana]|nr:hypothetical protein MRB53_037025 [Persea americana]
MTQYDQYSGYSNHLGQQQQQQQPLASINNLPIRQTYSTGSPAPTQLPPLSFPSTHLSFQNGYRSGPLQAPRTPQPNGQSANGQQQPHSMSHLGMQSSGYNNQIGQSYSSHTPTSHMSLAPLSAPGYSLPSDVYAQQQGRSGSTHSNPYIGQQPLPSASGMADSRMLPAVGAASMLGNATSRPSSSGGADGHVRSSPLAIQNADKKYVCQICGKTYQHMKHLKRHHLRHTGERPYQCSLCKDTFCRSDILKRHFGKCSLRRGNPQGLGHLTHAQDHIKPRSTSSATSTAGAAPQTNGLRANWPAPGGMHAYGPDPTYHTNGAGKSERTSRDSSQHRPGSSDGSEGRYRHANGNVLAPHWQFVRNEPATSRFWNQRRRRTRLEPHVYHIFQLCHVQQCTI